MGEQRRVTLRDVARLASVSPSAAAAALRGDGRLHPDTRARILAAAEELGYRRSAVARALRRSSNGVVVTVMYAMPSHDSLRRPKSFWEQALFGYVQELATEGIGNVFIPDHQAAMLADLPADVVVFFNLPQGAEQGLAVPHGVPTVRVVSATDILNGAVATMHGANVVWDYHAALGEVFTHLLASGAQSPGLLLPPKPLMPTALIRQAHEDWCRRHGRGILRSESADVTAGARELLARGCDGFVVHGDDAAGDIERVMDAIRSAGRDVPRDVLLASISDGRRESAMQPAVTTISYDGMASGILIARVVIEGLQTGRFHDTELEWELQPRASTAR